MVTQSLIFALSAIHHAKLAQALVHHSAYLATLSPIWSTLPAIQHMRVLPILTQAPANSAMTLVSIAQGLLQETVNLVVNIFFFM